jgi:flagellar hook protein FlgE
MRLESALYTSRAGIDVHGTALGIVGDNVSNVSTTGFKRSRAEFSSLISSGLYSEDKFEIGSGAVVSGVRPLLDSGIIEPTSRALDAAISGDGFFVVGDPESPSYTRAGNFSVQADGVLVTADGLPVLGFTDDSEELGIINTQEFPQNFEATTNLTIFGNLSSESRGGPLPPQPAQFIDITRDASFIARQEVFDSLGTRRSITVAFYRTPEVNSWVARAYVDGATVGQAANTPVQIGGDATLQFSNTGLITEENKGRAVIAAKPTWSEGAAAGDITIDLGGFSQFSGISGITATDINGQGSGEIEGFRFETNGTLNAVFKDGSTENVGRVAVASFVNNEGLRRIGRNNFAATIEAGERTLGEAGLNKFGTIEGFSLERSNVDIASEFVDLTLLQRGYQANSQTLSTTSDLLRETIQLLR